MFAQCVVPRAPDVTGVTAVLYGLSPEPVFAGRVRETSLMSSMQSPAARVFNALSDVLRRPAMRPVTRTFSTLHAVAYRLTGGRAQNHKYPTMLLTVTGRKTGKPRTVPVIYIKEGDRFVIAAAYSGSDTDRCGGATCRRIRQQPWTSTGRRSASTRHSPPTRRGRTCGGGWSRCTPTSPNTRSGRRGRSR